MNGDSGAGVVTAPPPTTAPHKERYFDRVDESSPEYQRERNMAPDLRQDFNMMEQRKRVSMILQSPAFCDELETMIQDQLKKGKTPTSLLALQQIADFMTTSMPSMYPAAPQGGMAALNMSLGMVTPVNDLRGSDSISYDKGEKLLRCKLAAFYRLADLFSWSELIYNHLTVRVNSDQERFLIVPFGLLYSEVTASSLVKINLHGEIVDRGSTNLGVNQAGFILHSAIYAARPDVKCIVHIHTPAGAAVSAMKCGLLPISPEALSLGEVTYHDYHGILVDEEETTLIQRNLGPNSKVLILRNHGLVSVGETVEEAFYYIHNLVTACEIQVRTLASAGGPDNLVMLDPSKYKSRPRVPEPAGDGSSTHPKWQIGEQEFEALMRMLDNLGYRTGYPYRCPALRDKAKKYSDVEIPPSAHGGYSYGEDSDSGARSPLKQSFQRGQRDKTRWLNAGGRPDEPYEDGPDGSSPKSKPKVWTNITHDHVKPLLQSLSSGVCVPSCITNCLWTKEEGLRQAAAANQFIPLNTNPKEVLEMRNKIREQNLQDIKTAGPQSQVLCASTVVERTYNQGELVTASKAIIEKEYQPKVIVSKQGPNPFTKLTDQELEEYCKEVEQKQKGPEVQRRDDNGASTSSVPRPEPETLPRGQASVSTPLQSATDSPSLERAPPAPPTPATPASEPASSPLALSSEAEPAQGGADSTDDVFSTAEEVFSAPDSPHKEFHCAVLRALSKESSVKEAAQSDQAPDLEQLVEPEEEEAKSQKPTTTPPSTPVRAEEESLPEQTYKDESDAATLRQTLPDLTPDDPSDAPALPAEDSASAPAAADAAEGEEPADAGDQEGEESPSKSPSKKKKKFRTPSFLKKNKKKTES
ncbi:alpha-adducin isoform X1 [Epinephelus moara]|uniref:alpha-adducin isoform X1 n=1 Tax=Epinephelus moara TaxID=300413 RepID=UPI00214F1B1D|nr:alpha-adducin isoform X1 [Epinephelus moara]XP_049908463.1 alpha-adducin isoform X1 [Epinephelus moara]